MICKICGEEDCGTMRTLRMLKGVLLEIVRADDELSADGYRDMLIYRALYLAASMGFRTGFGTYPDDPARHVAFIELPTGQVSWKLPEHTIAWDWHSPREKYLRINAFQKYMGAM